MKNSAYIFMVSALTLSSGCGSKSKLEGMSIAIPATEPLVRSATPSAFLSGTPLHLETPTEKPTPAQAIKSRIYSSGPTDILGILASLDKGMDSTESRVNGKLVKCLADYEGDTLVEKSPVKLANTVDFNADGTIDKDLNFPQYLNCYDQLTAGSWRAFGKNTESGKTYWYIREGAAQTDASAGAMAAKVAEGTDEAEIWLRVGKEATAASMSTAFAHLKRKVDGTIEYTHTGSGIGYDCGLHLLSKNGLVYFKVAVDEELRNFAGKTCENMGVAVDKEYCIDASGATFVTKDQNTCTAAGLTSSALSLESLSYQLADHVQVTRAFTDGVPANVAVFSTEEPPAKN